MKKSNLKPGMYLDIEYIPSEKETRTMVKTLNGKVERGNYIKIDSLPELEAFMKRRRK